MSLFILIYYPYLISRLSSRILKCNWFPAGLASRLPRFAEGPRAVAGCRVCRNWCAWQAQPLFWHFFSLLTLLRNFNSLTLDISASVTVSNALTHTKYILGLILILLVTTSFVLGSLFNYLTHPFNYLTQNSGRVFECLLTLINYLTAFITYPTLPTNYLTPPSIYRSTILFFVQTGRHICERSVAKLLCVSAKCQSVYVGSTV